MPITQACVVRDIVNFDKTPPALRQACCGAKKERHYEDVFSRTYHFGSAQHGRARQRFRRKELLRPIGARQLLT